jgi:hypothetical protein
MGKNLHGNSRHGSLFRLMGGKPIYKKVRANKKSFAFDAGERKAEVVCCWPDSVCGME